MKKLLQVALLITAIPTYAAIVGMNAEHHCEGQCKAQEALFSTFSFPTLIFHDKELNLGSEEAKLIILSEAVSESGNDPVSEALAKHLNKDVAEVQAEVLEMYSNK